jgi:ribosomal protein S18 acetylase RimI-like enzyme
VAASRLVTTRPRPEELVPVRLGPDHLRELYDFLVACDTAVIGQADITEQEVAADLRNPAVEAYGWRDASGRLVAHGYAERVADSEKVVVDVYVLPDHPDQDLGLEVFRFLEERGQAAVAGVDSGSVLFDMGAWRHDRQTRDWLRRSGYESPTSFVRMRIDLDTPVDEPETAGVRVRRTAMSDEDVRTAHQLDTQSFGEHFGFVPVDLEHYRHRLTEHGDDFTQLWLAELDGAPAGLLIGTRRFQEEHDAGYVDSLATAPAARGRGVGKALLRAYFAAEQRAGRSAVLLHVDVANVSGALAIYESVGMRPIETIDAWVKRVPLDG